MKEYIMLRHMLRYMRGYILLITKRGSGSWVHSEWAYERVHIINHKRGVEYIPRCIQSGHWHRDECRNRQGRHRYQFQTRNGRGGPF